MHALFVVCPDPANNEMDYHAGEEFTMLVDTGNPAYKSIRVSVSPDVKMVYVNADRSECGVDMARAPSGVYGTGQPAPALVAPTSNARRSLAASPNPSDPIS